ncbi:uncharacterized protein LOC124148415 [Haliotis rufescens]|uniref:uncharacterized protein LOC124148415 n=1 Tax=Haliotis rufescens TaxID=6454 RepID=UPI001EB0A14A|nr:uncharacterized protein LOC124148415 [Haliotis rufescens]
MPVAYASRAMTTAETHYAQIEKEALAMCFGAERFHQYVYGRKFLAETDHKPLIPIFKKALNDCPPRIQRFRLRMQKYDMEVMYTPCREMYAADTLSRNFPSDQSPTSTTEADVQMYVDSILSTVQVSTDRFAQIRAESNIDPEMTALKAIILTGWPNEHSQCPRNLDDFWNYRDELSCIDGVVFKGNRIVVPKGMRKLMLQKIHAGHLGQEKCKQRAREVLFWPRMNHDVDVMVSGCETVFRKTALTDHAGSKDHNVALLSEAKSADEPLQALFDKSTEEADKAVITLLRNVYFVASENLPLQKFESLNNLAELHGAKSRQSSTERIRQRLNSLLLSRISLRRNCLRRFVRVQRLLS